MEVLQEFDVVNVERALAGTRFQTLRHFATIDSTNTRLVDDAAAGAPDGTVYVADEQTAGRGRGGHTWHSPPAEGLYLSALVRSPLPIGRALWLSLASGLSMQRAIRECTGVIVDIRWPNDLLLHTAAGTRKVGGILIETAVEADSLRYAVIGIGVNVNQRTMPAELGAASLLQALPDSARGIGRGPLLIGFLCALEVELRALEQNDPGLLERFAAASSWVRGKRVSVAEGGGYTGLTDGLNDEGFLQVLADDGSRRTVLSGGVREA